MRYLIGLVLFVFIVSGCSTAKAVKEDVVDAKDWTVERTIEGYEATKKGLNNAAHWTKKQFTGEPKTTSDDTNVVNEANTASQELQSNPTNEPASISNAPEQSSEVQKDAITEDIEVIDLTPDTNVTK